MDWSPLLSLPDNEQDLLRLLRSLHQSIDSDYGSAEEEELAETQWAKPPPPEDATERTRGRRRPAVVGTVKRRKVEMENLHAFEKKLRSQLAQLKAAANEEARIQSGTGFVLSIDEMESRLLQKNKADQEATRRQLSVRENNGLRTALQRQIRMTKSLRRLLQRRMRLETMKNAVALCTQQDLLASLAASIRIRSDLVFDGLIVGLDEIYANVDKVFEKAGANELPCPGRKNLSARNNLKFIEFLNFYAVPFSVKSTERAVWGCLAEYDWKGPKNLASSYFDKTRNALLTYWVAAFSSGDVTVAIKNCRVTRRYVEQSRTVFISQTFIDPMSDPPAVFYETMRLVVRENGMCDTGPISMLEAHREATGHDKDDVKRIVKHDNEVGAAAWDAAVTHFNHRVEDALVHQQWLNKPGTCQF
ncbi:hypothetical protein V7S43_003794 [Phytophthora oleae]|uniref:M96 mating-specific protein family n=1 Tax=Phytophthora oleae TaxID=2107226 RepID=A0ABD3FW44_9STRA